MAITSHTEHKYVFGMHNDRILRRLGPQNGSGSSGLEKLLKIVSCAETEKLKEAMVGPQVE